MVIIMEKASTEVMRLMKMWSLRSAIVKGKDVIAPSASDTMAISGTCGPVSSVTGRRRYIVKRVVIFSPAVITAGYTFRRSVGRNIPSGRKVIAYHTRQIARWKVSLKMNMKVKVKAKETMKRTALTKKILFRDAPAQLKFVRGSFAVGA